MKKHHEEHDKHHKKHHEEHEKKHMGKKSHHKKSGTVALKAKMAKG